MDKPNKYLKSLTKNYQLAIDSSENNNLQLGGNKNNIPFGGFPPIFLCSESDKKVMEENKKREYSKNKNAVLIKEIMGKRREEENNFINL